jgi:hypothetical protein
MIVALMQYPQITELAEFARSVQRLVATKPIFQQKRPKK